MSGFVLRLVFIIINIVNDNAFLLVSIWKFPRTWTLTPHHTPTPTLEEFLPRNPTPEEFVDPPPLQGPDNAVPGATVWRVLIIRHQLGQLGHHEIRHVWCDLQRSPMSAESQMSVRICRSLGLSVWNDQMLWRQEALVLGPCLRRRVIQCLVHPHWRDHLRTRTTGRSPEHFRPDNYLLALVMYYVLRYQSAGSCPFTLFLYSHRGIHLMVKENTGLHVSCVSCRYFCIVALNHRVTYGQSLRET